MTSSNKELHINNFINYNEIPSDYIPEIPSDEIVIDFRFVKRIKRKTRTREEKEYEYKIKMIMSSLSRNVTVFLEFQPLFKILKIINRDDGQEYFLTCRKKKKEGSEKAIFGYLENTIVRKMIKTKNNTDLQFSKRAIETHFSFLQGFQDNCIAPNDETTTYTHDETCPQDIEHSFKLREKIFNNIVYVYRIIKIEINEIFIIYTIEINTGKTIIFNGTQESNHPYTPKLILRANGKEYGQPYTINFFEGKGVKSYLFHSPFDIRNDDKILNLDSDLDSDSDSDSVSDSDNTKKKNSGGKKYTRKRVCSNKLKQSYKKNIKKSKRKK